MANRSLSWVWTLPSGPPSCTSKRPNWKIARLLSLMVPAVSASTVVDMLQLDPIAVLAVAAHPTVKAHGESVLVPTSAGVPMPKTFSRSVWRRYSARTRSWPV